jgi:CheY-like chemotaxis protein
MMPVMDGWQFLEWKKEQNTQIVNLPVIVVSAVSSNTKAPDGVKGFLNKPVSVSHMLDYIAAYC